jgi:hypothetical protein
MAESETHGESESHPKSKLPYSNQQPSYSKHQLERILPAKYASAEDFRATGSISLNLDKTLIYPTEPPVTAPSVLSLELDPTLSSVSVHRSMPGTPRGNLMELDANPKTNSCFTD